MASPTGKDQKMVVYTAIIGNYDQLKQPSLVLDNCDYICFTDQTITNPGVWQIRPLPHLQVDNTRLNRFIKLMPHRLLPEYPHSLYIDGSIEIIGDISSLIEKAFTLHSIATFSHPFRNCFYEEANFCMMSGVDNWLNIYRQIKKYKHEGYPEHHGLVEANVLIRKHKNEKVIELMEAWWSELIQHSRRDQLSFNYVCWKNKIGYQSLGVSDIRIKNNYFILHPHTQKNPYLKKIFLIALRPFFKLLIFIAKH